MPNPRIAGGVESPQGAYEASTIKHHALGTRGTIGDRVFYYAKHSGSGLTKGQLCRKATVASNHRSVAWASGGAANATSITLTLGATSAAENLYEDGWIVGIDGTASGEGRTIVSHPSASSGGTVAITVADPFNVSATTSDEFTLVKNLYADVDVTPGDAIVHVVGVPQFTVGAGSSTPQYFWIQTYGPALVVGDNATYADGQLVTMASATTADAGQVTVLTASATAASDLRVTQVVGEVIDLGDASSDGDHRFVRLKISA